MEPLFSIFARTRRADSPRLRGDAADLALVILVRRVDLLGFGDPFENEVFFQRPGGGDAAVLAEDVFVGVDFVVREAAALHLHRRALQLPLALPLQQPRRQLPARRHGQAAVICRRASCR